jgi:hypothetical protein
VGLERLDAKGCGDEAGAAELAELAATDLQRWRELGEYQSRVARWNRLAGHRRRFRRQLGDAGEFLAFLGLAELALAERALAMPPPGDAARAGSRSYT